MHPLVERGTRFDLTRMAQTLWGTFPNPVECETGGLDLSDRAPIHIQAAFEEKVDRPAQRLGFQTLSFGDDFLEFHARQNFEAFLGDDGAFVEMHAHEVRGDTNDFDAVFVGLAVGLGSGKTGQKGRVDVDDLVFVPPDEVGRQDLHEPGQDDEIDVVRFQFGQGLCFGGDAVIPGDVDEGHLELRRHRGQFGVIRNDDGGFRVQFPSGKLLEQRFQAMRLSCGQKGDSPLPARISEADLNLHLERLAEGPESLAQGVGIDFAFVPGGLQGHAELAPRYLFLERLNVGPLFEEKMSDARDDAGLVFANDGDGCVMLNLVRFHEK